MAVELCKLNHALHLVVEPQTLDKALQYHPDIIPIDQTTLLLELAQRASNGVAAVFKKDKQGEHIIFCTMKYALHANLTRQYQDGYYVFRIEPTSLPLHRRLSQRAVRVNCSRWFVHSQVVAVNRIELGGEANPYSGIAAIKAAWEKAKPQPTAPSRVGNRPSPAQLAYLEQLDSLIDLTQQLEIERAQQAKKILYTSVSPVAAARIVGDEYLFTLAEPPSLMPNSYVSITPVESVPNGVRFEGMVVDIQDNRLQVKFRSQIDLNQLPITGIIRQFFSSKQYKIQHEAVAALRFQSEESETDIRQCLNQNLLNIITQQQFKDLPLIMSEPVGKLNAGQRTFIDRAGQIEDMLLWGRLELAKQPRSLRW